MYFSYNLRFSHLVRNFRARRRRSYCYGSVECSGRLWSTSCRRPAHADLATAYWKRINTLCYCSRLVVVELCLLTQVANRKAVSLFSTPDCFNAALLQCKLSVFYGNRSAVSMLRECTVSCVFYGNRSFAGNVIVVLNHLMNCCFN